MRRAGTARRGRPAPGDPADPAGTRPAPLAYDHAMRRRLSLIALALVAAALAAAPAHAAGGTCDPTGDRRTADDCVTHVHIGAAADGRVTAGEEIAIRQYLDSALRSTALTTEVQARRIHRDGAKGPWVVVRRLRWPAAMTAKRGTRDIRVCVAALAGRYQFRTATRVPRSAVRGRAGRSFANVLATSAPTGVTMPNGGQPGACANSPDDETNIELFNTWNFMEGFVIETGGLSLRTTRGAFISGAITPTTIALECPERPSPEIGATLGVGLFLAGQATGAGCNGAGLALDRATLMAGGYPECAIRGGVPTCRATLFAWNTETQVIYAETQILLILNGNQTMIPELNPATLPICSSTVNECLLSGSCPPSTPQKSQLQLCESATSCSAPPPSRGTGAQASVYFETVVRGTAGT